jgi:hypothetical protein
VPKARRSSANRRWWKAERAATRTSGFGGRERETAPRCSNPTSSRSDPTSVQSTGE